VDAFFNADFKIFKGFPYWSGLNRFNDCLFSKLKENISGVYFPEVMYMWLGKQTKNIFFEVIKHVSKYLIGLWWDKKNGMFFFCFSSKLEIMNDEPPSYTDTVLCNSWWTDVFLKLRLIFNYLISTAEPIFWQYRISSLEILFSCISPFLTYYNYYLSSFFS
jgi:hypothetical protein